MHYNDEQRTHPFSLTTGHFWDQQGQMALPTSPHIQITTSLAPKCPHRHNPPAKEEWGEEELVGLSWCGKEVFFLKSSLQRGHILTPEPVRLTLPLKTSWWMSSGMAKPSAWPSASRVASP